VVKHERRGGTENKHRDFAQIEHLPKEISRKDAIITAHAAAREITLSLAQRGLPSLR
jgi:hypothetical protein